MESIYKIDAGSDHDIVAKFRGDRPRELGDYALKKKHHEHFIRPPVTPYGRPDNNRNPSLRIANINQKGKRQKITLMMKPHFTLKE